MRLVVQKYGGTSVGTPERIRKVARRLIETQRDGCQVVAVISAMAGVTDNLLKLAQEISPEPTKCELDNLLSTGERAASALTAMAVNALGGRAISLTGAQAGILTDRNYTKAHIANISPRQIHELLSDDYIVIVAGFQGQTPEGETTTLGRGGSDLTAIALAGALNADACQIFTDVDGVFTCDPRIVKEAEKLHEMAYDELLEMAGSGANVMQSPVVGEIGAKRLNTMSGVAKLSVVGIGMRSHSGVAARMFECLGRNSINIQMVSTSEIKIAVILDEKDAERSARLIHAEFGLGRLLPAASATQPLA